MIPKEDLTDVTLVSGDTFLRLDWCDSGEWGYLLETGLVWLWCVIIPYLLSYHIFCHTFWRFDSLIPKEDLADVTLVSEDTDKEKYYEGDDEDENEGDDKNGDEDED